MTKIVCYLQVIPCVKWDDEDLWVLVSQVVYLLPLLHGFSKFDKKKKQQQKNGKAFIWGWFTQVGNCTFTPDFTRFAHFQ